MSLVFESSIPVALESMNSSEIHSPEELHCTRGTLTSSYGWTLQVILASIAFTCLIVKRFCEPIEQRRTWLVWFYDTSKQAIGALVIHLLNIFIADFFGGVDPCTQYIISFLLDSTLGLFIIYIGILLTQAIATRRGNQYLVFGEYGKPKPLIKYWYYQCLAYILIMLAAKIAVTILLQLHFWEEVQNFLLWPIPSPKLEVVFVVLIIPFLVNVVIFWVTDNLLTMNRSKKRSVSNDRKRFQFPIIYRKQGGDDDTDLIEAAFNDSNPFATNVRI